VRPTAKSTALILLAGWLGSDAAVAGETYDGWMFFEGTELRELCSSSQIEKRKSCAMYICGMIDGWAAEYIITGKKLYRICLPKNVTCDQLAIAVTEHLQAHPESQKSGGGGVVGYGLQLAYPCK
jgi:hypothetical protein